MGIENIDMKAVEDWNLRDEERPEVEEKVEEKPKPPLNIRPSKIDLINVIDRLESTYEHYPMKDLYDTIVTLQMGLNSLEKVPETLDIAG